MKVSDKKFQKRIVTIAALKGGIGKTFLSTNVAVKISELGAKVLLIDLDPEGCATNSLMTEAQIFSKQKKTVYELFKYGLKFEEAIWKTKYDRLDIIPASLRVAKAEKIVGGKNPKTLLAHQIKNLDYDFIFFELPPSFSTLSSSAYLASDLVVIPCTPNIYALESVQLTIEAVSEVAKEFEAMPPHFKIILNLFNPRRTASIDTLNILENDYNGVLLPFQIRESAEIQNAINAGLSIYEAKCSAKILEGMDQLVEMVCFKDLGKAKWPKTKTIDKGSLSLLNTLDKLSKNQKEVLESSLQNE